MSRDVLKALKVCTCYENFKLLIIFCGKSFTKIKSWNSFAKGMPNFSEKRAILFLDRCNDIYFFAVKLGYMGIDSLTERGDMGYCGIAYLFFFIFF